MSTSNPQTPAEHVARAKEELQRDGGADYAIAHALVAIAEHLTTPTNPADTAATRPTAPTREDLAMGLIP